MAGSTRRCSPPSVAWDAHQPGALAERQRPRLPMCGDPQAARRIGCDRCAVRRLASGLVAITVALAGSAHAAEISLESSGVQKLVIQALFKDRGRLPLTDGPCASHLEQPSVTLAEGRIQIRSRLVGRVGLAVGRDCAGVDLSSWTRVSGRPEARGGVVHLEDLRIDEVDDNDTRNLLAATGIALRMPVAVSLDVRAALQSMLATSVPQMQTTVEALEFQEVAVIAGRLKLGFEFRLVGR